jgi:hypothetical protein
MPRAQTPLGVPVVQDVTAAGRAITATSTSTSARTAMVAAGMACATTPWAARGNRVPHTKFGPVNSGVYASPVSGAVTRAAAASSICDKHAAAAVGATRASRRRASMTQPAPTPATTPTPAAAAATTAGLERIVRRTWTSACPTMAAVATPSATTHQAIRAAAKTTAPRILASTRPRASTPGIPSTGATAQSAGRARTAPRTSMTARHSPET